MCLVKKVRDTPIPLTKYAGHQQIMINDLFSRLPNINKCMNSNQISMPAHVKFREWRLELLIIMKIILFMFFFAFQASAFVGNAQVTLDKKNIRIEEALLEIRKQTGMDFFYDKAGLDKAGKVSISVNNVSLEEALDALLKEKPVRYTINQGIVTLSSGPNIATDPSYGKPQISTFPLTYTQTQPVTGVVRDVNGNPIPNVNIEAFSGTYRNVGFRSDEQGEYRITVRSLQDTLRFSIIGYQTRVVPIQNRQTVPVVLSISEQRIEDVVVTGIYQRRADSYTGAVQTITKEQLKKVGSVNLFQALRNISPSMVLDNFEMGSNPNTLPELQIRGTSTFPTDLTATQGLKGNYLKNPNEPLFIVDGFESSMERVFDLDINRIETVTILKDAASKALYGSKAANGVIVIETTRVSSNRPLVSYTTSLDVELPDLTSYNLTNATEKLQAEMLDGFYDLAPRSSAGAEEDVILKQLYNYRKKLVAEGLDTYWLAKPLRDGIGQRHALSVELGGRDLRVVADVSYTDRNGVMKGSGRENITGGVSASYRLSNLLFRNITNIISNNSMESPFGTFSEYSRMNPYWRAENPDGTIPYYAEQAPNGRNYLNPLFNSTLNSKNSAEYLNFINNFYLEWSILPELRAITRIGIDMKRSSADEFYPAAHTRFDSYSGELSKSKGSYQVNSGTSSNLSGDFNLNYSKQIDKHTYFANAGFNVSERNYKELFHLVEGFPSEQMNDISFGRQYALNSRPQGISGIVRDMGFLAAASYMWDERFMTDLTARSNASSQFGADKRWALFYSAGLGWNVHNEAFLKNSNWIQQFKIRGSVGSTGNQNFNTNASIATYEYFLDRFYQGFPGVSLNNMVNPGLQWESKLDYNAGFDARMAGVSLSFDYYESYTENLLTDVTIPYSTGFSLVKENLGKVKNNGIEASASWLVWSQGQNFISLNGRIETNKNKIVELSDAMRTFNDRQNEAAAAVGNNRPVLRYEDGMSMNAIWAVRSLGIDPANGREIFLDRDNNTTYTWRATDMVVAGNANPSYQGVFGVSGEYKRIGASITARFLGGGQYYNQTLVDRIENIDMNYNVDRRVLTGRWQVPGQIAEYRALGYRNETWASGHDTETTLPSTRFVQDRKDLNIAAVNVYYDFAPSLLTNLRMQRLRVAFNMNELAQFSTIELERGLSYPFSRTFQFSLMATF